MNKVAVVNIEYPNRVERMEVLYKHPATTHPMNAIDRAVNKVLSKDPDWTRWSLVDIKDDFTPKVSDEQD